jgi:hypothetical protein
VALGRDQILERLAVELGGDVTQLIAGLVDAERATKTSTDKIVTEWQKVGRIVSDVTKALAGFVAAQAKASATALIQLTREAIKTAAAFEEMAQRTGVSSEQLSTLELAAKGAGVSIGDLELGLRGLTNTMTATGAEGAKARATIEGLGLDFDELAKKSPDQQFLDISDALSKFEDGAGKSAAAADIFGQRIGPKLVPFMNQGRAAIEATQQVARNLGQEISTQFSKDADKFEDQLLLLEASSTGLARQLAEAVLPELNNVLAAFISGSQSGGGFQGILDALGAAWTRVADQGKKALLAVELVAIDAGVRVIKALGLEGQFERFIAGQSSRVEKIRQEHKQILAEEKAREDEVAKAATEAAAKRAAVVQAAGDLGNLRTKSNEAAKLADLEKKAIEDLQRQITGTRELSQVETVLAQNRSGAFKDFSQRTKDKLLVLAQEADKLKELDDIRKRGEEEEKTLTGLRNQLALTQANTAAEKDRVKVQQDAATIQDDARRAEFVRLNELIASESERQKQAEENLQEAEKLVESLATLDEKRAAEIARVRELATVNEEVRAQESVLIDRINEKFDEMGERGKKASKGIADEGKKATESLRSGFVDILLDPVNKGFDDLLKNWIDTLKRMAAEQIAAGLFGGGGKGKGGGGLLGGLLGGIGFAAGGLVHGPGTETSDSIRALLSRGEFVQPAAAVRYYGAAFMEQIRRLQAPRYPVPRITVAVPPTPRFADGGLVAPAAQAVASPVDLSIVNVSDRDAALQVIASRPGTDTIFNVLGANVDRLQKMLGGKG